jgi:hypothetical protein
LAIPNNIKIRITGAKKDPSFIPNSMVSFLLPSALADGINCRRIGFSRINNVAKAPLLTALFPSAKADGNRKRKPFWISLIHGLHLI